MCGCKPVTKLQVPKISVLIFCARYINPIQSTNIVTPYHSEPMVELILLVYRQAYTVLFRLYANRNSASVLNYRCWMPVSYIASRLPQHVSYGDEAFLRRSSVPRHKHILQLEVGKTKSFLAVTDVVQFITLLQLAWFQASAAKLLRTAHFCDITQNTVIIPQDFSGQPIGSI